MPSLTILNNIIFNEEFFNPINLEEEKSKFFKNKTNYNPNFKYKKIDFPADDFKKAIEQIILKPTHNNNKISTLVQETARELMLMIELLKARGTDDFPLICEKIFSKPSHNTIIKAKEISNKIKNKNNTSSDEEAEKTISSEEALKIIREELQEQGINYELIIEKEKEETKQEIKEEKEKKDEIKKARAKIRNIQKRIILQGNNYDEKNIKRIIKEITIRTKRYTNGEKQEEEVFKAGTAYNYETEEGLVLLSNDDELLMEAAVIATAINKARNHSFKETYDEVRKYYEEKKAFEITLKAKKGIGDTSKPGANTMEANKISGFLKLSSLKENDKEILMSARISLNYLPLIKGLIKEKKFKII